MSKKEKSWSPLTPGPSSSLASSCSFASSLSLASSGVEVKENDDFSVIIDDSSRLLEKLQEDIDRKFTPKKESSCMLADSYLQLGYDKRAFRVLDCGTFLQFYLFDGEKKLHKANFCKDRLCPMCNWRRSLKIYRQVSQVMDFLEPQGFQFGFLTLTVRSCSADDLPDTIQAMFDGWRYLYNKNRLFKTAVAGTHRSLEVTRNKKTLLFHPHFHNILAFKPDYFTSSYISQREWSSLWRKACSLEYEPVVHIRKFKPGKYGIASAVAEASKYAVKDSDFLSEKFDIRDRLSSVDALLSGLSGRRLVSDTGCFLKARQLLSLSDPEDGDLVNFDDLQLREDVVQMIVRFGWRNGIYVRI